MSLLTEQKFSFISKGIDTKTFTVVSFKGFEAISKPYEFEIFLVSEVGDIDPLKVLHNPAVFTIHRAEKEDVDFNGILILFEETREVNGYFFFKAVLAPKFWWLGLTHHNQVFLNMTSPQIMTRTLKDGGLFQGIDFKFDLNTKISYLSLEYVCQYDESHFNFLSRWAEREGIYYFFEQTSTGEKVVFTDTKIEHKDLALGKDLIYDPPSGLDALHTDEVIKVFTCKHGMLPQKIYLKDYNYLKPSQSIEGSAVVDEKGRGENYIYGEHFDSTEEGNRLAQIRAEALLCRKTIFQGESSVPFIAPGYTFDLKKHYKKAYNRKYLVTEVSHVGHQAGYLIANVSSVLPARDEEMSYANSFTAIYSNQQFRPEHLAKRIKISGTINAKIDAESSGEYAELDEYGRYKVVMPFDRSGRPNGKASAWFRMVQPYAGQNKGMHFPLNKGTEVLLTFIDGHPDRPVIAGAVPNPETASPVTSGTQTAAIIKSNRDQADSSPTLVAYATTSLDSDTISETEIKDNTITLENASGEEGITIQSGGSVALIAEDRFASYTTGVPSDRDEIPSEVRYLWDQFFAADPCFNPTGMVAYDYNFVGTAPDENDVVSLKKLIPKGYISLMKGDYIRNMHGNYYNFSRSWGYNVGESYAESFIHGGTDSEPLVFNSSSLEYDKAAKGGPLPGSISCNKMDDMDDTTWISKTIGGASYSYKKDNNSLSVQYNCQTESHAYETKSYSFDYALDGTLYSKSFYEKGVSEQWEYDRSGGGLIQHAITDRTTGGVDSFKLLTAAETDCNLRFGAFASFSLSTSISTDVSVSVAASAKIDIAGSADFELKTGLGIGLELDLRGGGTFKLAPSGGLKYDGIGFTARSKAALAATAAALEAETKQIVLDNILTQISQNTVDIASKQATIYNTSIQIVQALQINF
ncbi:MAG: type VI secretion system tip protein VgrG [Desulfobacteraceae bacterium]|nr:type VI secretion system tip protein VgrG [Desulfobacteraceae bacterium]